MIYRRALAMCATGLLWSTHAFGGQVLSQYRNFELGSDVAVVSATAGVAPSEAKTIHERPALLQDLEWRPSRWIPGSTTTSTDPVEQLLFNFYNNQLFRVVVDYSAERTEGMTQTDMIEAISAVYGTPLPRTSRAPRRAPSRLETESGAPVARWEDAGYTVGLYQTTAYGVAFRLIVTDTRLESLALTAEAQARRLDDREAPQRDAAQQQKKRDDDRVAAEKARAANKRVFRT